MGVPHALFLFIFWTIFKDVTGTDPSCCKIAADCRLTAWSTMLSGAYSPCSESTEIRLLKLCSCDISCFPRSKCETYNCVPWTEWWHWSKSCGARNRQRNRTCITQASSVLISNSSLIEETEQQPDWSGWTQWTPWWSMCGSVTRERSRNRTCEVIACNNTKLSGPSAECTGNSTSRETDSNAENFTCCPMNSYWGQWSAFSALSMTCGMSQRTRTRVCVAEICGGAKTCSGSEVDIQNVTLPCCPVSAGWSNWGTWTPWSATCASRSRTRMRNCGGASCGGTTTCPGAPTETVSDSNSPCCPFNLTDWTPWAPSCGIRNRTRAVTCSASVCCNPASSVSLQETNVTCCPVTWSAWGLWGSWNATCGLRIRTRHRNCTSSFCGTTECTGRKMENQMDPSSPTCSPPTTQHTVTVATSKQAGTSGNIDATSTATPTLGTSQMTPTAVPITSHLNTNSPRSSSINKATSATQYVVTTPRNMDQTASGSNRVPVSVTQGPGIDTPVTNRSGPTHQTPPDASDQTSVNASDHPTSTGSTSLAEESSSWLVPTVAGVSGLVVLTIILVIVVCCVRRVRAGKLSVEHSDMIPIDTLKATRRESSSRQNATVETVNSLYIALQGEHSQPDERLYTTTSREYAKSPPKSDVVKAGSPLYASLKSSEMSHLKVPYTAVQHAEREEVDDDDDDNDGYESQPYRANLQPSQPPGHAKSLYSAVQGNRPQSDRLYTQTSGGHVTSMTSNSQELNSRYTSLTKSSEMSHLKVPYTAVQRAEREEVDDDDDDNNGYESQPYRANLQPSQPPGHAKSLYTAVQGNRPQSDHLYTKTSGGHVTSTTSNSQELNSRYTSLTKSSEIPGYMKARSTGAAPCDKSDDYKKPKSLYTALQGNRPQSDHLYTKTSGGHVTSMTSNSQELNSRYTSLTRSSETPGYMKARSTGAAPRDKSDDYKKPGSFN